MGTVKSESVDKVVDLIQGRCSLTEMRRSRGKHFKSTGIYQLRFKANDLSSSKAIILDTVKHTLTKKLGFSCVVINEHSVNSGSFSSVSAKLDDFHFDVVIANGSNRGEKFEQELLAAMNKLVLGSPSDLATQAFESLKKVDSKLIVSNVESVRARTGSTLRSGVSLGNTGEVIGDIVITLKNGDTRYISVKDSNGESVGQFGIAKAFNDDLSINTESKEWVQWINPFHLDHKKLAKGLKEARDDHKSNETIFPANISLVPSSEAFKIISHMWGTGYIYLKKHRTGFDVKEITKSYVTKVLLKNLKITEFRYPGSDRKSTSIYLESDNMRYRLQIRNPHGAIKPTIIQLSVASVSKKR